MKSNPFDKNIYDSCLNETCTNQTQHKSGYCEKCRKLKCQACGKEFVASNTFDFKRPKCGYCKIKGKMPK